MSSMAKHTGRVAHPPRQPQLRAQTAADTRNSGDAATARATLRAIKLLITYVQDSSDALSAVSRLLEDVEGVCG